MNSIYSQSVQATAFREKLEQMSLLAGDFMKILNETQNDYKLMQSPIHRNTYNLLLSKLITKLFRAHMDDKEMYMDEELLSVTMDVLQRKIAHKLKTPGQIWDSEITNKTCKLLSHTPIDERKENTELLKCVSELPAFHPVKAGPGSWHSIHVSAMSIKNMDDFKQACRFIRNIQENFYCEVCKKHFGEYLRDNPPEDIVKPPRYNLFQEVLNVETNEKIVVSKLFDWTVNFHNKVNQHRINHSNSSTPLIFTLFDAYKIYYLRQYETCESCKVKNDE